MGHCHDKLKEELWAALSRKDIEEDKRYSNVTTIIKRPLFSFPYIANKKQSLELIKVIHMHGRHEGKKEAEEEHGKH